MSWWSAADKMIRDRYGLDPLWASWAVEAIGVGPLSGGQGALFTGAVCPLVTRGPRKGEPNYRKADPRTKATYPLSAEDLRACDEQPADRPAPTEGTAS